MFQFRVWVNFKQNQTHTGIRIVHNGWDKTANGVWGCAGVYFANFKFTWILDLRV